MLTLKTAARWIAVVYAVLVPLVIVCLVAPAAWNPLEHPAWLAGIVVGTMAVVAFGLRVNMSAEARSLVAFIHELAHGGRWEPGFKAAPVQFGRRAAHLRTPRGRLADWPLPGSPSRAAAVYLQAAAYGTFRSRVAESDGSGYRRPLQATARLELVIEVASAHALPPVLVTTAVVDGTGWREWLQHRDWQVLGPQDASAPDPALLARLAEWTRGTAALVDQVGEAPRGALMTVPSLVAELILARLLPGLEPALEAAPGCVRLRLPALLFERGGPREKNRARLQRRLGSLAELCAEIEAPRPRGLR